VDCCVWLVQKIADQVHIVMGISACDTAVIESPTAVSSERFEVFKASAAVTEGDADPFLYLARTMPKMPADTLAPMFLHSAGTVNSIGVVFVRSKGSPLGHNIYSGSFCPGDRGLPLWFRTSTTRYLLLRRPIVDICGLERAPGIPQCKDH
jgi:hypothetical protein